MFCTPVMFSKLSHFEKRGRQSNVLNETKVYAVDELKYMLKNHPEVKFQRYFYKIQAAILNIITDN